MSWPNHRWLFLCWLCLVLKDCQSFFVRQSDAGRCIKPEGLVYVAKQYALPYWAVMTDNCLDVKAQFRFDDEDLKNINTGGTLAWFVNSNYQNRLSVYKGVSSGGIGAQNRVDHHLKQTNAGSLKFYNENGCALPSTVYVERTSTCDTSEQKITFGAITNFSDTMESINCSPKQRMLVHRADYGDFVNNGVFDNNTDIDTTCSVITNCQVKSRCGGKASCELTMNNNLLPSHYCPDTTKEIFTEHTCVSNYMSNSITGPNVRLSQSPSQGFIEIKDDSTWRKFVEEKWDEHGPKILCQYLGFNETEKNNIVNRKIETGSEVATGDLICYTTQPNGTSCCILLKPSTSTASTTVPYVTCGKTCDKPLLQNLTNSAFSGNGGSPDYEQGKFNNDGWCAAGSEYLLIDLQNEYHITRVVTMGDKNQTKWSESFTLTYNHNESLVGRKNVQITGNHNGYQASIQTTNIYNVRHMRIESTTRKDFCVRIELCGEVQSPAPVQKINAKQSNFSVHLSWTIPDAEVSSYITHFIIYLNGSPSDSTRIVRISREKYGNEFVLRGLKPYTDYTVGIQAQDGSSKNATIVYRQIKTEEAVPSGPPLDVVVNSHSTDSLIVSWKPPDKNLRNGKLTGYQVCYNSSVFNGNCFHSESSVLSYDIPNLLPSTKYFVTVAAGTRIGYGNKSLAISKITNGEPINAIAISFSSLNVTLTKQATYIKEVMVIIQVTSKTPTPVDDIRTNDLKPYQTNTQDPYITAYFKADVLPLTLVIGDGKKFNFKNISYYNHPLQQSLSYILFLRFFENKNSYYSTEWSSSVKTLSKPSGPPLNVTLKLRGKTSLDVSWVAPDENVQSSELTGYQVCFYTRDTTPECLVLKSNKVLSLTLQNLRPSTKYFVTVAAITKAGYGEKSLEVSKITNGEAINPLRMCYYTLSLDIPKQKDYIREVIVIVENSIRSSARSENLEASDLTPYQRNIEGPYVAAYMKADVLPLMFVIGDGKEYNSEDRKYFNQPLKQNSNYIVFLRFFENQNSYYTTEWSSNVTTMMKPSVEIADSENAGQSNRKEIRIDLLIPLVISISCFLLSLFVIVYQRRLIQNNNKKPCCKCKASVQAQQMTKFDSLTMKDVKAFPEDQSDVNDEAVYELPDSVMECTKQNQAAPQIVTGQQSSTYMSLKDNKEPGNVYQSLQPKKDNMTAMEYENPAFTFSSK